MNTSDHDQCSDAHTPDDARLEALLRGHHSDYLPDDGFSARVLNALPANRSTRWRRPALLASGTLLGTLMAFGLGGGALLTSIRPGMHDMMAFSNYSIPGLDQNVGVVVTLACSVAVSWTACRKAMNDS